MDEAVTQKEHEEFVKRMEAAHARYDKRLELAETKLEAVAQQANKTELLAQSVSNLAEAVKEQSARISALEDRDGDMWRTVVRYAITAIISIIIGYAFAQIGM